MPATNNDEVTEEEQAGLSVGTMESQYDEGDDIDAEESWEVTASKEATWTHNAGQIYKHTSSAIDELLSNSITAVLRARNMFEVWDAGVMVSINEKGEDEVYLTIRDEGIGMTESFISNVLAQIGLTTGHMGEDVNSKFGRGFYSAWMLVGEEKNDGSGAFTLSTNPRVDEKPTHDAPHNILCKPGKLERVETHEAALDEDEYGTRLHFPIRDGVTADELESWVRSYAKYARIPIMFERKYPDGTMDNDEIGGNPLEYNYADDSPEVVVEENGLFRAVASPDAEGNVIILDAKTDTNASLTFPTYNWWNVDIRLLSEDGAIYDSPDESKIGKTPVSAENYEDVPDNKKDQYILKSEVDSFDDKTLPEPSGTRDIIELPEHFTEFVFDKLEEQVLSRVQNAVDTIDEPTDWNKLDGDTTRVLSSVLSESRRYWNFQSIADDDTIETLQLLSKRFKVIEEGTDINDRYNIRSYMSHRKHVFELLEEYDRVFYGNSILQRRADAVWEDGNNAVIQVKTDDYETLDEIGWDKITEIRSTTIDEFDVSDDIVEEFKSVRKKPSGSNSSSTVASKYDDRKLKIHHRNYSGSHSVKVGDIRAEFGDDLDDYDGLKRSIGRLVLFTSTSDHKISSHKHIVDEYTATANCVNRVYEQKLAHLDEVVKFEDYADHELDYEIETTDGTLTVSDMQNREVRFLHLTNGWNEVIQEQNKAVDYNLYEALFPEFDGTVALVDKKDIYAIRPHFSKLKMNGGSLRDNRSTDGSFSVKSDGHKFKMSNYPRKKIWSDLIDARFPDWESHIHDEVTAVRNNCSNLSASGKTDVLNQLARYHDSDEPLTSETDSDLAATETDFMDTTFQTSEGEMTVSEIVEDDRCVVLFPIEDRVSSLIDEIPLSTIKEFVKEATGRGGYHKVNFSDTPFILLAEDYDMAQTFTREVDGVRVVKPKKSPSLGNAKRTRKAGTYYTRLYAYWKAQESNAVDYSVLKNMTGVTLLDQNTMTGYSIVESMTADSAE